MRNAANADQSGSGVEINAELGKFADFREFGAESADGGVDL